MKIQHIVGSGVLKIDDKILVIRRSAHERSSVGYWEVPKGKVEFGENPPTAVKREFLEETGLRIELGEPVAVLSYTYRRDGNDIHFWNVHFLVHLAAGESLDNIRLSEEHDAWQLVGKDELAKLEPMHDDRKTTLLAILDS